MRILLAVAALCVLAGCRSSSPQPQPEAQAPGADAAACALATEAGARELLAERTHPGAIVVIDLVTGEELAAVHHGLDAGDTFPPASTVKPFLAAAALERGLVGAKETVSCDGTWRHDDAGASCFASHGAIGLPTALATSCNVYFYELAVRLGPRGVADAFSRFGLDELAASVTRTTDLPAMISTAIGHGEVGVTPRALARAYARLAREGAEGLAPVRAGLRDAVAADHGTATAACAEGLLVAGKTGTAESHAPGSDRMHAWFVGYAPAEAPRVLVLAYLDASEGGGAAAAPVAGRMFELWRDRCASP